MIHTTIGWFAHSFRCSLHEEWDLATTFWSLCPVMNDINYLRGSIGVWSSRDKIDCSIWLSNEWLRYVEWCPAASLICRKWWNSLWSDLKRWSFSFVCDSERRSELISPVWASRSRNLGHFSLQKLRFYGRLIASISSKSGSILLLADSLLQLAHIEFFGTFLIICSSFPKWHIFTKSNGFLVDFLEHFCLLKHIVKGYFSPRQIKPRKQRSQDFHNCAHNLCLQILITCNIF